MLLPAIGVGMGLAGSALGAIGNRRAARQQRDAINRWQDNRRAILSGLADRQRGLSDQSQGYLTQALSDLSGTPDTIPGQPSGTADHLPAAPAGTADYSAAFRAALAPTQAIDDAALAHQQARAATTQRGRWTTGLLTRADGQRAIGRSSYGREAYLAQKRLMENDAALQGFRPSNSTYNLNLLGSLLSGGSGALAGFGGMA